MNLLGLLIGIWVRGYLQEHMWLKSRYIPENLTPERITTLENGIPCEIASPESPIYLNAFGSSQKTLFLPVVTAYITLRRSLWVLLSFRRYLRLVSCLSEFLRLGSLCPVRILTSFSPGGVVSVRRRQVHDKHIFLVFVLLRLWNRWRIMVSDEHTRCTKWNKKKFSHRKAPKAQFS